MNKSTVEEIRLRFDQDVERFSNLDTGQVSTMDADISLEILTESAKALCPNAQKILDIGCGAGNYTLKMLSKINNLDCTLVDLSQPMLDKALERVSQSTKGEVNSIQSDVRNLSEPDNKYDIILAGAVLHHLRDDQDWISVFQKLYNMLKDGGCLMISDLIIQDSDLINKVIWNRYANYLENIGGKEYCEKVLNYIEKEDSPRSINFQFEIMKKVGFKTTEILHKKECFAAYCGIK